MAPLMKPASPLGRNSAAPSACPFCVLHPSGTITFHLTFDTAFQQMENNSTLLEGSNFLYHIDPDGAIIDLRSTQ